MVVIFIILIPFNVLAQNGNVDPYEYGNKSWKPRPFIVPAIQSIVIKEEGRIRQKHSASTETIADCAEFKLNKRDIYEFFLYSRRISNNTYWNVINFSNCYAAGEVTFVNGDQGLWEIDAFRRGVLTMKDGSTIYFYCTKCTAKAFYDCE